MPPTGDRRSRERYGLIDNYTTLAYNALRRHMPETMDEPEQEEKAMAAAA
jgi:hypothetical protein